MVDAFRSRFGIRKLKKGSPILSALEAAAQSDLRSSQDIFDLLNSRSLDQATGLALDRIGADEGLPRFSESPSSGTVTVSDTSFTKVVTSVYQGQPAPIIGSNSLFVADASAFPTSGSLYLGRGSANYEGPLRYSASTNSGTYWTLTLTDSTRRFHNLGESVILAQGGNRSIPAGTIVQTPQGNATDAVKFTTLFTAIIPDGETQITGVQVASQLSGVGSNVTDGAISAFTTQPFAGAAVTNPLPFTNGLAAEDDTTFRERIRQVRQSRTKGTALAITTNVKGIVARDEHKRLTSASIVTRQGLPTTLYIDDGTGYEEVSTGIALETLVDQAQGGEQYFQVSNRPVAKASLTSSATAPFPLTSGSKLAVRVAGTGYEHSFTATDFRNIGNGSAYEVVSSINANPLLGFSASTAAAGTKIRIFSKQGLEDIEAALPSSGTDANAVLLFPVGVTNTMRLYRNDVLLSRDGAPASLLSNSTSLWGAFSSGATLTLAVDGTAAVTYTFVDQDFVNANTGYTTVGRNDASSWAKVLNAKIPGISASASNGLLQLVSNLGNSSRASISIIGGTLVNPGQMFAPTLVQGLNNDYSLDRNTGQIRLQVPLSAGDSLSVGTLSTRAFVQSLVLSTSTLAATGNLWVAVDGNAQLISTGLTTGTVLNTTVAVTESWGGRIRVTADSAIFSNLKTGDYVLIWDSAFNAAMLGTWRIAQATGTYFEIERRTTVGMAQASFSLATNGVAFVRALSPIQALSLTAGTYTAKSFVDSLNTQLQGAAAKVFHTTSLRLSTNTYSLGGDLAVLAADTEGSKVKLPLGSTVENLSTHLPSVQSGNKLVGTPEFTLPQLIASSGTSTMELATTATDAKVLNLVVGLKTPQELYNSATPLYRFGHNFGSVFGIQEKAVGATTVLTLRSPSAEQITGDRVYLASPFCFGAADDITAVVDQDLNSGRFTVPLYRRITPVGSTYGTTNSFRDADNGGASLAAAFGLSYDFNDFAVYMASRVLTHSSDTTKSIIWRYTRLGPDGDVARIRYVYPTNPSQALTVGVDPLSGKYTNISVSLPSGSARTGYSIRSTTKVGTAAAAGPGGLSVLSYVLGYSISNASRDGSGNVVLTLTLPSTGAGALASITAHGFSVGDNLYVNSANGSFPSGAKTVTAVTATTVTYVESGTATSGTNIGTVSNDPGAEANFSSASIVTGDILRVETTSGLPAAYEGVTIRVGYLQGQLIQGYVDATVTPAATPTWTALGDTTALKIFSLNAGASTAMAIAAAVKSFADAQDSNCPVTAKITGTGSGTISLSSSDEALTAGTWFNLSDGFNYVKFTTPPGTLAGDYQLVFKLPVSSSLATGSDWASEDLRLVPTTTKNLVNWLSNLSVTGISSLCAIEAADQAQRLQITSLTAGSAGAVQVQGGSGNLVTASVVGSTTLVTDPDTSTYPVLTVKKSDAQGLIAGAWVSLQNSVVLPKNVIQSGSSLLSLSSTGVLVLDPAAVTPLWSYSNSGPVLSHTWQVEKHGKYTCFSFDCLYPGAAIPNLVGAKEGDWVQISSAASPSANAVGVSSVNTGIFRVVRVEDGTVGNTNARAFWIENNSSIPETVEADIAFFSFDSVMPGDTLSISTSLWGAANQGLWVVQSVGAIGGTGPQFVNSSSGQHTLKLAVGSRTPVAVSAVGALGSQYRLIQVLEATPTKLIKRVRSISPNQADGRYVDIKFRTSNGYSLLSSSAGTVLTSLDKLSFSTNLALGVDGYSANTGLVAEAGKVLYGDPRDPAAYPGVVAAGATVNISGPLIKRITCSLSIRSRLGADVADHVRSAVAAVINGAGVGQSIAISDIINAAARVNGVTAVSMISPTYSSSQDLIPVQPYEKPLVLNLDQDIAVSFAGA